MRPKAVANSASEMYGATTEIVALCKPPIAWNELMMPHTVPSKPTYGLVLLTVARNARLCSSRSISLRCETRIARRDPSMICSGLKLDCLSLPNSRNPASKMPDIPCGVASARAISPTSGLNSTPDQKLVSNSCAAAPALFRTRLLSMMTAHDATDPSSKKTMIACTNGLASSISRKIDRSLFIESTHSLKPRVNAAARSEEHTSELQSLRHLVCRLL